MIELKTFFERCYLVNLAKRSDRLEQIQRDVIPQWPLATIERWPAVDGQIVPMPTWWKAGKGAWGVYRSHAGILEKCLNEGVQSVLILEDDAVLCDHFTEKVARFLEAVPDDWDMIYLGGQFLRHQQRPPHPINEYVYQAFNINRCHAMAVSAKGMPAVYQWLHPDKWQTHLNNRKDKEVQDHIDHHLGHFHAQPTSRIYVPSQWLIGQDSGQSNICGKFLDRRFWQSAVQEGAPQKVTPAPVPNNVVAVVGPFRSGTSCVAGMLHTLGVSMGRQFFSGRPKSNPKGYFEAKGLREVCVKMYREPLMQPQSESKDRVQLLRQWALVRSDDSDIIGAKHPALCLMVPEMVEAWPHVKVVSVTRDLDAASASLEKTGWWSEIPAEEKRAALANMIATRDADLERLSGKIPVLKLDFSEVLANPQQAVDQLVSFAGIHPTPEQRAAAATFVDPALCHQEILEEVE